MPACYSHHHGEIILDAPVAKLKRDYLKAKTVDLLLEEPAAKLLKTDDNGGKQRLSIRLPGSVHEEIHETEGVQVLEVKGHGLKLEVDTSRIPLEPIIAAIMQYCHVLDMTIADPPMEEIIAAIYGEAGQEETENQDSGGLAQQMLGALVSFSTYPMNIFSGVVRLLLFTVVPAGFISFVPLQLLHRFTWSLFGGMVGFTLLFVAIAVGLFELGPRHYESGNLMGMQN
jgi:hypothetical protein